MKVGDYVRTDKGEIGKVSSVTKEDIGFGDIEFCNTEPYVYGTIIKSSQNIIDLIEVGDYVNGVLVESIYQREKDKLYIHSFDTEIMICFINNNIETIVTKEQFKSMEYKIN